MIICSRKVGEVVMVGDIPVMVVSIRRGKARLGIQAPRHIPVDRLEIREAKLRSGRNNNVKGKLA